MTNTPNFVGIDVSKAQLDVALRPSDERDTLVYDAAGIDTLVARLRHVGMGAPPGAGVGRRRLAGHRRQSPARP
jgi:hypothetical protein